LKKNNNLLFSMGEKSYNFYILILYFQKLLSSGDVDQFTGAPLNNLIAESGQFEYETAIREMRDTESHSMRQWKILSPINLSHF